MRRSLPLLSALALPLLTSLSVHAAPPGPFDAYAAAEPVATSQPPAKDGAAGVPASWDPQTGAPRFMWVPRGNASAAHASLPSDEVARRHLAQAAPALGVPAAALKTLVVSHIHDTGRGGIIIGLRQVVGGIEVFHHDTKVLL